MIARYKLFVIKGRVHFRHPPQRMIVWPKPKRSGPSFMPSLATVPLEQLNLICVDLETTGSVPPEILQLSEDL